MSRVTPLLCPLLVGRDDLLDLADRRLADAAEGRGQFLLLAGEAGIGKTRFLGAVVRKASARGLQIADGAVAPQDRIVPAALILDLARTMTRIPAFSKLGHDLLSLPHAPEGSEPRSRRLLDLDGAREAATASAEAARAAGDAAGMIDAQGRLGLVSVLAGEVQAGLAAISRAAGEAREAGFESVGVTAYRDAATMAARVMDYSSAEASLREGMRYADAIEQSHCRHVMGATSALVAWVRGQWDDAIAGGEQELVDRGCTRGAIGAEVALGYVALGRGEFEQARAILLSAKAAGEQSGTVELILPALWGLAETEVMANQPGVAVDICASAFALATRVGERALFAPFAVTGVRAMLAAGRPDAAERWATSVAEYLEPWASVVSPAIDHANGLVRLASGSTGIAREALEAAVTGWEERGRVWESIWARVDLASCLLRSNRYADAAGLLASARDTAARLDSAPLIARIDELSDIAYRHGSFDEPCRPLTTREFEVARLIADGMTNGEIAGELSIAPKTASAHVEHILAKLGVARRAEIATWVATVARAGSAAPTQSTVGATR